MANTAFNSDQPPFDLVESLPFHELEDVLHKRLALGRDTGLMELRVCLSNILLGRNQEPTLLDAIMAERMYQSGVFRNYDFCARWEKGSEADRWNLIIRVKERGPSIPVALCFGEVLYEVQNQVGFLEAARRKGHVLTLDFASQFHGYTVFDGCIGFDSSVHDYVGWAYVKNLARDVRSWAGKETGDYYDAFVAFVEHLVNRKVAERFVVVMRPTELEGKVKLEVRAHRGPINLAGFTTVAEFNEVLIKEKE